MPNKLQAYAEQAERTARQITAAIWRGRRF